ncbi:MAG: hypothetical protein ACD_20C00203G0003 [uncultured bacterium]|nr:MAG: hypothetical protein ACD_20C00203G0003 [uncultured bacterium]HBH17665.1 hypothetical protein [Cyanobacteria bacterium UBA9579]
MPSNLIASTVGIDNLTIIFNQLKSIYRIEDIAPERKEYIVNQVRKYSYLPYPHIKALEELTPAETIIGLEEKLSLNHVYNNGKFTFSDISPVKRAGFIDSSWIKTDQHSIKLINLAGLGNGNKSEEPGKFIDWLKQLLILPAGNIEHGILATTVYLIPFHPRDFGCAYLPTSSDVSPNLEDSLLKEKMNLNVQNQVRLFLILAQLAGHPTMYDVLPQTGRFSKTILANPYVARWFDVKELISKLMNDLQYITENFKQQFQPGDVDYIHTIIERSLMGQYEYIPDHLQYLADKMEEELDHKRKWYSHEMMERQNQEILHQKVQKIINEMVGKNENAQLEEDDIANQGEIIGELIKQGLWPAPGGAWCSSGIPIFNKMSKGAAFPLFKHYNQEGKDVTEFANLDCQTPYYFVYLETGEYNEKVIDFYVNFLKKIQSDYNFDGFRVDHIDHIVDAYSESELGKPISYRAPKLVLGKANRELKKEVPHFAALAEYMLWENFFKEYHQFMDFDLLWGSDIVSQYLKNVAQIIADNKQIEEYNSSIEKGNQLLSILKTYNNQDGEFRAIDQYPAQLSEEGALFKWFKFKFLPNGKLAQRPVLYVDGDESFTKTGIEKVIGQEISMERNDNYEFYRKFDAISRFAMHNEFTHCGIAQIHQPNEDKSGFVSWIINKELGLGDDEKLFIVTNENPPTEVVRKYNENGNVEIINQTSESIYNKEAYVPEGFRVASEYILPDDSLEFVEIADISNISDNKLIFEKLDPSEFHIYKLQRY